MALKNSPDKNKTMDTKHHQKKPLRMCTTFSKNLYTNKLEAIF